MKKSWKRGLALYLSFVMTAGNFGSGISYSFAAVNGGGGTGMGKATSSNAAGSGSGHTHTSKATSSNADSGSPDREPDKRATESNATMSNALKLLLEKTEFSLTDDFTLFFVSLKNLLYLIYFNILQRIQLHCRNQLLPPPNRFCLLLPHISATTCGSLPLLS